MIDLTTLNTKQQEAVKHTEGPLLILAGAGSGKTRVLTHRIAYILENDLAQLNEILAVTFTNKAANEMKERIAQLLGKNLSYVTLPFMGTFHSVCVKILRAEGDKVKIPSNFSIYDSDDQLDAVKSAMKDLNISIKEINPRSVLYTISSAKNELILPSEFGTAAEGYFHEVVARVYPEYQNLLEENNAMDFDDLIMKVVLMLKNHPNILDKYQTLFKYILVDEYQDTNKAQYALINLLAKKHKNIAVVGDDDQSIYAFRGATVENILHFEKDYPDTKVVKLEQNYRSTKTILNAAHAIISQNPKRKEKKMWTEKGSGEKIIVHNAVDESSEAAFVAETIETLINDTNVNASDTSVLYRTNAQSRTIEEAFLKAGLAYKIVGGIRFYERKEVKDVLAYLRTIYNPQDELSTTRIINVPRRGIGAKTITKMRSIAASFDLSIAQMLLFAMEDDAPDDLGAYVTGNTSINQFANLLFDMRKAAEELSIVKLIKWIIDRSGYVVWLDDGTEENAARIENIQELVTVASKYDDLEPQAGLEGFLTETATIEEEQTRAQAEAEMQNATTLMTLHSAKGLEFEYVFLVGMEEGIFPHSRSYADPFEMSEERRLAYVGITRAKNRIYMTRAETRRLYGTTQSNIASRFIEEIPAELLETSGVIAGDKLIWESNSFDQANDFLDKQSKPQPTETVSIDYEPGDTVRHAIFGKGKILSLDDDIVTVTFENGIGTKSLAVEFAKLEKV